VDRTTPNGVEPIIGWQPKGILNKKTFKYDAFNQSSTDFYF
jgi:hypothetical protein